MTTDPKPPTIPKAMFWTGVVLGGLPALLMLVMGGVQMTKPASMVEQTVKMGYSEAMIVPLAITMMTCALLYLIPQTAVLGAILLTGYLGGAVATHVQNGDGPAQFLFPALFGVLIWLGLYLRAPRLRALVPLRGEARTVRL